MLLRWYVSAKRSRCCGAIWLQHCAGSNAFRHTATITRVSLQGLKPLLPMLVALYRVLQITAGDVAHDAAISHYFPVPLHGGSAEDAIAAFAAQQLEHLATLFGVAKCSSC